MKKILFSYKTTLPIEANAPCVKIIDDEDGIFDVSFFVAREDKFVLVSKGVCKNNQTIISGSHQWYDKWLINVHKNGELIAQDLFDPRGRVVL